jgi:DNA-binding LytR/AlgR family response regulator
VALADAWDTTPGTKPFPALVFVTAYDQYAVAAFEAQALDYVLKPVQTQRLQKTVAKLQAALASSPQSSTAAQQFEATLAQLRALLVTTQTNAAQTAPLKVIQASVGNAIHMVPIDDVVYFEAADKYLRVLTPEREYLIRTPLKDLLPQLDPHTFWQIHRGTVVRASTIAAVHRDEAGKASLSLRVRPERLAISRLYTHLFRAM